MSKDRQIYEIRINQNSLILATPSWLELQELGPKSLVLPYAGKKKVLFQYLDTLEKSDRFERIIIHAVDLKTMYSDLKSICNWVPAAGGLIENEQGNVLVIYRNGFWDLPKGKIDSGEFYSQAALRECREETGLNELSLENKIHTSWHLYRLKNGQRALKKTKWYKMISKNQEILAPQIEEGIERCEWYNASDALALSPMYSIIREILLQHTSGLKS